MTGDFTGKVALVTGAARGLGHAIASELHRRGARIAVNDLDQADIVRAVAELGGGDRLGVVPADVSTVAGCEAAVGATVERFGRLDVLVNNAGVDIERPIEDWDEAHWDCHVDVILKGAFFCVRAAVEQLRANRAMSSTSLPTSVSTRSGTTPAIARPRAGC